MKNEKSLYRVNLYFHINEDGNLSSVPSPIASYQVRADNYKYAAAAALKLEGITKYTIDNLLLIKSREKDWQRNVHVSVISLDDEYADNNPAYFYLFA